MPFQGSGAPLTGSLQRDSLAIAARWISVNCLRESRTRTNLLFMQLRGLLGHPRPFREIVVRPRPTATSPSIFALASLATGIVLTATVIGVSQLGTVLGPSAHDGRIMAVPQMPGRTSPFFGFGFGGTPPAVTATTGATTPDAATPDTIRPNTPQANTSAGAVTGQSHSRSSVSAGVASGPAAPGLRYQAVTAVSAVLHAPSAQSAGYTAVNVSSVVSPSPVTSVVSVASSYPLALVAHAPAPTSPAVAVALPASEQTRVTSKHVAKRSHAAKVAKHVAKPTHAAKVAKHKPVRQHAKPARAHRSA